MSTAIGTKCPNCPAPIIADGRYWLVCSVCNWAACIALDGYAYTGASEVSDRDADRVTDALAAGARYFTTEARYVSPAVTTLAADYFTR